MINLALARNILAKHTQTRAPSIGRGLSFTALGLGDVLKNIPLETNNYYSLHEFYPQVGNGASSLFMALLAKQLSQDDNRIIFYITHPQQPNGSLYLTGLPRELVKRCVFIHPRHPRDGLWAFEEALRSKQAACVIAEVDCLDLKTTRRLQLACEMGETFGFAHCLDSRGLNQSSVARTRWRISGHPQGGWWIELCAGRGVKPGGWRYFYDAATFSLSLVRGSGVCLSTSDKAVA